MKKEEKGLSIPLRISIIIISKGDLAAKQRIVHKEVLPMERMDVYITAYRLINKYNAKTKHDPNADIIIIDPEREYSPLVKAMQGEVIHISATSENHINAMDMNSDYGDGANPVILKSEFILSL